jgi:sporulation protein YlmC with PRC-barrel domain
MLRLTALLGRPVLDGAGTPLGELDDLAVALAAEHPPLVAASVRAGRGERRTVGCVTAREGEQGVVIVEAPLPGDELLLLRRHVLDAQVVDLDGRRIVRVGDVLVAEDGEGLALVGVEVGIAPVLRRLGLGRLARHGTDEILDWRALHLASRPGHVLQLGSSTAAIHSLTKPQLEAIAATMPAARAHELRRHFGLPHRPRLPGRRRGRRFGAVLRARTRAPR